ncbi:MAG: hydrogenase formation protein HypD [Candidatus Thorarchaeota archaeon]
MNRSLKELTSILRSQTYTKDVLMRIRQDLDKMGITSENPVTIMHVCGTHEDTLMKYGIRDLLKRELGERLRMVAGPGCPVCVSPVQDIDFAIALSNVPNVMITSYGDMVRVPGSTRSLEHQRKNGRDIRIVYSVTDAVKLSLRYKEKNIVFLSPGFETTVPGTAVEVMNKPPSNFFVLSSHRLVPPALNILAELSDLALDGFILPGHVSVIIGERAYESLVDRYQKASAISGFEPLDILQGISAVIKQLKDGIPKVINTYGRAVTHEGNIVAQKYINKVFQTVDAIWRGLGTFSDSGLDFRPEFAHLDARSVFGDQVQVEPTREMPPGCLCHKVVIGVITPHECPLYLTHCTPEMPIGPCMVGLEGTCRINAIYGE